MQHLFKIFGKLKDSKNLNNEGTGLGLYISSCLITQLGGTIRVDSEFGKFTEFTIEIPENPSLLVQVF